MEFSEKIKLIRKHNYLTQEEFAKKINVSRKTVSGWENGRSVPDVHIIKKISEIFFISESNLTDTTVGNIFDNNDINSKSHKLRDNILIYLLGIQLLMILISYLSLFKLFSAPINSILLAGNTIILSRIINQPDDNYHSKKLHKNKSYYFIISSFNFLVGSLTSLIYMKFFTNYLDIFYVFGMMIGTIMHIIILTYAVTILISYYLLYKNKFI